MKNLDSFVNDLKQLHIELSDETIQQFVDYYDLLIEWNAVMNLTAITEFDEVLKKHFVDSLSFIKAKDIIIEETGKNILSDTLSIIDIGTGAGFPGIPLKITLLDSLNKRVQFLNEVIEKLGLKNIQAIHGRAEDFARNKEYREQYDIAVSRAVANMSTLSEYCIPFVKNNGLFIPFKSEKISEELAHAENALNTLNSKLVDQIEFNLPNSDLYRNLVIIKKKQTISGKYPRKAGMPSKNPL